MSRPFPFVYLASQSPRRRQLLQQLGVAFSVFLPPDQMRAEALEAARPGEAPARYVRRVAELKLDGALTWLSVEQRARGALLCADTTVALGRRILGKPQDAVEASAMLRALSGRTHRVLTAVAVAAGDRRLLAIQATRVRFGVLSETDVAAYVDSGEWQGKAGGYAIQGRAAQFVQHISGSYSGVMGLPLFETAALLRQLAPGATVEGAP